MEFFNNIGNFFRGLGETFGIVPPKKADPAPAPEAKPPTAEDTPADSLQTPDAVAAGAAAAAAVSAAGAAAASVALNTNQSQKDQWVANGAGPKATLPTEVDGENGKEATTNKLRQLSQYIKDNYSEEQQATAKAFLQDVKSDPSLISKITEGLTKTGITDSQVEQLVDGNFNIADYKELVNSGQPIG